MGTFRIARYKKCGTPQKLQKPHESTREFWESLKSILAPFNIISTRGAYYQAESAKLVGKDDAGYNKVQRAISDMRRAGVLDYSKIQDNTRVRRRVWSVDSFQDAADVMLKQYRYNYWQDQPIHVEVWCEKEALAPQIQPICEEYGVHFAATRGFDSDSFAHDTAKQLARINKPVKVYYFGDHDPSGWWAAKSLEQRLFEFGANVEVYHAAVLPEQIRDWNIPTRRASKKDTRYNAFVREFGSDLACEVDAIPPDRLAWMVHSVIKSDIAWGAWQRAELAEQAQRETTESVMRVWASLTPGTTIRMSNDS